MIIAVRKEVDMLFSYECLQRQEAINKLSSSSGLIPSTPIELATKKYVVGSKGITSFLTKYPTIYECPADDDIYFNGLALIFGESYSLLTPQVTYSIDGVRDLNTSEVLNFLAATNAAGTTYFLTILVHELGQFNIAGSYNPDTKSLVDIISFTLKYSNFGKTMAFDSISLHPNSFIDQVSMFFSLDANITIDSNPSTYFQLKLKNPWNY